jgi:hypothetical protein
VFGRGSGCRAGNAEHIREAAHTLARYHRIVASFHPTSQPPQEPLLNEVLRERLSGMPSSGTASGFADVHGENVWVRVVLASLPHAIERAGEVLNLLDRRRRGFCPGRSTSN